MNAPNMTPAEVLAVLDEIGEPIAKHLSDADWQKHADIRTAVAAVFARVEELEADARRWRLARMMITPGIIDIEESERANEGEFLSEQEACQSDATIDRILKAMADDDARAEGGSHG